MNVCHSCLKPLNDGCFSFASRKKLFDGRNVSCRLEIGRADFNSRIQESKGRSTLSISGAQEKIGLVLDGRAFEEFFCLHFTVWRYGFDTRLRFAQYISPFPK